MPSGDCRYSHLVTSLVLASMLAGSAVLADQPVEQAKALSQAFRNAAQVAKPAVVTITSHYKLSNEELLRQMRRLQPGNPLPPFPQDGEPDERGVPTNVGSGVIIDASGVVLTNAHVVRNASDVEVRLADGNEFKASDIRLDPNCDLAVLRIQSAETLPVARMGDSTKLDIGDWVIAIGSPFELEATVSVGIISAKGRSIPSVPRARLLQTDANINPGNSGGPLVNLDGEIVGINTAIATNSGVFQGVGFAVPASQAKWISRELLEHGRVRRAWLGIGIGELTATAAKALNLPVRAGVYVDRVEDNTPAAVAGIKAEDVIVEFGGLMVRAPGDLQEAVEQQSIGTKQSVIVLRRGDRKTLDITVEALPENPRGRRRPENAEKSDETSPEKRDEKKLDPESK